MSSVSLSVQKTQIIKPPLAAAKAVLCVGAVHLFVCLPVAKMLTKQEAQLSQRGRAMLRVCL